ncbi:hypothetical protein PybrP1_007134 [[Pythium] brassicae (nom. inval.)]|nr:hypothetical protein PybrP1_007134 [[Pythium] brassicae (nom. inval.)]
MHAASVAVAATLLAALGATSSPAHAQTQQRRFLSDTFAARTRASPAATFHLALGLRAADFDALERRLWDVSDPRAASYGRHLSREEADGLAQPADGALAAVRRWLQPFVDGDSDDVGTFSPASNILKVPMTVERVETLFGTEIHEFEAAEAGGRPKTRILRAARDIAIPEHLQDVIAFVNVNAHPLGLRALASTAPSAGATASSATATAAAGGTLGKIRDLYRIPADLMVTNASNTQCVPSFYMESWNPDDLAKFFKDFLPGSPLPTVVEKGTRANAPEKASTEASLDIQYITGVARNATTFMWTMNGSNPFSPQDEPFVEFAQAVLAMDAPPLVVSISYSDDEEQIYRLSPAYARTFDTLLIKMGLRGITVLVASGDDGVAGLRPEFAKLPANETCLKAGPQWPSSSPYITTVGATTTLSAGDFSKDFFRTNEEVVCSGEAGGQVTTGGGFSNVYPMPAYQQAAVARYLQSRRVPQQPGYFNTTGRAYPDISALGAAFHTYIHGYVTGVSGTSASTPVIGAMVTLWNDARLNAGKSPLGFINPLLYFLNEAHPSAFNDVVVGNNGARKGGLTVCEHSFGAAGGWDAATGVGTPNFPVILAFVQDLEDKFNLTTLRESSSLCNSTASAGAAVPRNSSRDTSLNGAEATGDSSSVIGTVALVVVVAAAAVLGAALLTVTYKRWRNQYTQPAKPEPSAARRERR